jgi:hypothetical protein
MYAIMLACVKLKVAGIKEVVLSEKGALGAGGPFDRGHDTSMVRCQPGDDV